MQPNNTFWDGGSKTMFFTGLFLGVALTSVLALGLAVGTMMNGRGLAAVAAPSGNAPTAALPSQPTQPSAPAVPVAAVDAKDHIRGPADAKVTLIEYSDFQCPYCSRHLPTLTQVLAQYPKDVRLVYRHFPLSQIHPQAQKAGEASECAAKLGGNDAFWKAHDYLFANQGTLGADLYAKMAGELNLNAGEFTKCLDSGEMSARVAADYASGNDSGVSGTPATFVNGVLIEGAQSAAVFAQEIDAALKK